MKNRTKLPNIYLGVMIALMYLPIVLVIIYSFNESKISSVWDGFSLRWYKELFRDNEALTAAYPQLKGKLSRSGMTLSRYLYDDAVDTSDKSVVVDWYYKKVTPEGKTLLHLCFVFCLFQTPLNSTGGIARNKLVQLG